MAEGALHLILLDSDTRRRARISHALLGAGGIHVEPFEDVSELIAHWPKNGLILAHDDGATLEALADHMLSGDWLPVVAFADQPALRQAVRAMQGGVLDYLELPFDDTLYDSLASAQERGAAQITARRREAAALRRIEKLSPREHEVLIGVARGLSNDLIAHELGISSRTVEIHRANMLGKMDVRHSSEAIRIAVEAALLDSPSSNSG